MRTRNNTKGVIYLGLFVFLIIFYIWFYSATVSGEGTIQSKWTETHTSCSDGDCTTTTTYLVQFSDGTIYAVFWGTRDWDRIIEGSTIRFEGRGRNISFFGWRIMQPSIFSYETTSGPPR